MRYVVNYRALFVYILSLIISPFLIIYLSDSGAPMANRFTSDPVVMAVAAVMAVFAILLYFSRLLPVVVGLGGDKILFYAFPALKLDKENIERIVIKENGIRFRTKKPVKGFIAQKGGKYAGMYSVNIPDINVLKALVEFIAPLHPEFDINWKVVNGRKAEIMKELIERTGENNHDPLP